MRYFLKCFAALRLAAVLLFMLTSWSALAASAANPPDQDVPAVAAASDLQFALSDLAERFARQSGRRVRLSFGSSGNFYRQISQGAPFELFLSADEGYVLDLAEDGLTLDRGALYGIGRIVIMVPPGSPLKADGSFKDLAVQLGQGRFEKFAIANPDHAPYGRAARSALEHAGLWTLIAGQLVLGENVSQAAQFVTSGSVAGGIIAYSLALSPKVSALGRFALIPADWHAPLRQRMALTIKAGDTAKAFYAYLGSPQARAVLKEYGFSLPQER